MNILNAGAVLGTGDIVMHTMDLAPVLTELIVQRSLGQGKSPCGCHVVSVVTEQCTVR